MRTKVLFLPPNGTNITRSSGGGLKIDTYDRFVYLILLNLLTTVVTETHTFTIKRYRSRFFTQNLKSANLFVCTLVEVLDVVQYALFWVINLYLSFSSVYFLVVQVLTRVVVRASLVCVSFRETYGEAAASAEARSFLPRRDVGNIA